MTARAEDRYYAEQIMLPHLRPRALGSIVAVVGVVLILGTNLV